MKSKPWIKSKTLWANALSVLAVGVQAIQGAPWCDPYLQMATLAMINAALRSFTNQPLR